MRRQLRQVFPFSTMISALIIFLTLEVGPLYSEWFRGFNIPRDVPRPGAYLPNIFGALYGVYRIVWFHPFYRPDYRKWLELTPWTRGHSLPLGPAWFIWVDVIVLGLFCLPSLYLPQVEPARVCGNALLFASLTLAITFWPTGVPAFGYAVAMLGGLAVRLFSDRWVYLAATLLTYGVAFVGLWSSFGKFPWRLDSKGWSKVSQAGRAIGLESPLAPLCGWPYDLLRPPVAHAFRLDFRDAVLISMLTGWWIFALVGLISIQREREAFATVVWFMGSAGLIFVRFIIYRNGHAPQIGLWTRLRTGRFLIPAYDQIYIAPVCAAVVGAFTPRALSTLSFTPEAAFPMTISLVMLIVLTAKPSLTGWQLTGGHRLAFPAISRQDGAKFVRAG